MKNEKWIIEYILFWLLLPWLHLLPAHFFPSISIDVKFEKNTSHKRFFNIQDKNNEQMPAPRYREFHNKSKNELSDRKNHKNQGSRARRLQIFHQYPAPIIASGMYSHLW